MFQFFFSFTETYFLVSSWCDIYDNLYRDKYLIFCLKDERSLVSCVLGCVACVLYVECCMFVISCMYF